jgi:hypothetical protein
METDKCHHHDSGRGVCVECGEFLCDEQSTESTYTWLMAQTVFPIRWRSLNRDAVQRLIDSDPTISKSEAKTIHRLLAGWRSSK